MSTGGRLGIPELKTPPDTLILISKDVERVFSGPGANHVFFTKLDESVWSFGGNENNKRGFEENKPNEKGIRLHNDLALFPILESLKPESFDSSRMFDYY